MTQNSIKQLMREVDELDARWRKEQPQIRDYILHKPMKKLLKTKDKIGLYAFQPLNDDFCLWLKKLLQNPKAEKTFLGGQAGVYFRSWFQNFLGLIQFGRHLMRFLTLEGGLFGL